MQLIRRRSGFSLIESVIAAAILLLTCAAVGGTLTAVLRAERAARQRSVLDQVLAAESARLASLPFFIQTAPPRCQAPGELRPTSLLAEVFPHALPEYNSADAWYCDGRCSGTAGSFVTLVDANGLAIRRETRFVVGEGTQWEMVMPVAPDGWAVWISRRLPATTVEIVLSVHSGDRTASTDLLLGALRAHQAPPLALADGGSQGV